jgi:hypothetical protein
VPCTGKDFVTEAYMSHARHVCHLVQHFQTATLTDRRFRNEIDSMRATVASPFSNRNFCSHRQLSLCGWEIPSTDGALPSLAFSLRWGLRKMSKGTKYYDTTQCLVQLLLHESLGRLEDRAVLGP